MDLTNLILGVFMFISGFLVGSSFAYLKAYIHFHKKPALKTPEVE